MTNLDKWLSQQIMGEMLQDKFRIWLEERIGKNYENLSPANYNVYFDNFADSWLRQRQNQLRKFLFGN